MRRPTAARRGTIALGLRTVAFSEWTSRSLVKPNEEANQALVRDHCREGKQGR